MKHNKKRNTAFIYETLSRELTKAIVDKNDSRKRTVLAIIKEGFGGDAILAKELSLYNYLLERSLTISTLTFLKSRKICSTSILQALQMMDSNYVFI
jgi:hypothetical protein